MPGGWLYRHANFLGKFDLGPVSAVACTVGGMSYPIVQPSGVQLDWWISQQVFPGPPALEGHWFVASGREVEVLPELVALLAGRVAKLGWLDVAVWSGLGLVDGEVKVRVEPGRPL